MIIFHKVKRKVQSLFKKEIHPHNVCNSTVGRGCKISKDSYIKNSHLSDYVGVASGATLFNCSVGLYSYISLHSALNHIDIGKFCSIAQNVKNRLASHPTRVFVSTHPAFYSLHPDCGATFSDNEYHDPFSAGRIIIGNDVWIGADVVLMDGIHIGDGAIIAARAVVTKSIPPYAIVGGLPARLIRYRFEENIINELLKFKWWDKELDWLQKNYKDFHNIDIFRKKYLL